MISENRDILLERLEQQLAAKENDINELRISLKDSIIDELRDGMKEDLDFDKRISYLERKIKETNLAYDGVMKELLDQKTVIRDLKNKYLKTDNDMTPTSTEKPSMEKKTQNKEPPFIIANSDEGKIPTGYSNKNRSKINADRNDTVDIIIAEHPESKPGKKGKVIVEAREDEDVVIEYRT